MRASFIVVSLVCAGVAVSFLFFWLSAPSFELFSTSFRFFFFFFFGAFARRSADPTGRQAVIRIHPLLFMDYAFLSVVIHALIHYYSILDVLREPI